MKNILFLSVLLSVCMMACNSGKGIFNSGTPREKYARQITQAGLATTALGSSWLNATQKSINFPLVISLPFRQAGYFESAKPSSNGYSFQARRGQIVTVELIKNPQAGFRIFMELWKIKEAGNEKNKLLQSVDTTAFHMELEQDGLYSVLLQPELLAGGSFDLTISASPSLAFPVKSSAKARIGSFWGDQRDAGARSHEGIDIFGTLRTPVVAAAEGTISRVNSNKLGGKVIFMRPTGKQFSLYYAHLDSQIANAGDYVTAGQVIGLMGKTGNAKNTPVHLHFGIYTNDGAIDPLPFIRPESEKPPDIIIPRYGEILNEYVVTSKQGSLLKSVTQQDRSYSFARNTTLKVTGATGRWYHVITPSGIEGYIEYTQVSSLLHQKISTGSIESMRDQPLSTAPIIRQLPANLPVTLLGYFENFAFIAVDGQTGWIPKYSLPG